MKEFVVGGAAAMSASCVTHPIDLIKVRMLLHGEAEVGNVARLNIFGKIYRSEGITGLYKGLSAALVRQGIYSTTRFGFYDLIKRALGESKTNRLPYYRKIIATMAGGSLAALVACPADLMLVRMQADGRLPIEQRRNYKHVFDGLYRVAKEEGIRGLYRGVGPLVVRGLAVTSAQFSTYDQVKETLISKFAFKDDMSSHFLSSLCAGLFAAIVSTPLDVIKSRMMNSTKDGQHGNNAIKYTSSIHCVSQTIRIEGLRGLFKGFIPCYMRMGPQVILMWTFVEQYRKLWDRFVEGQSPSR